ncbi:MAG: hypothetical protein JNM96_06655, partial [Bacteroidia bacterium]|nr:hypothetical protein [Bacteroidia bacterium]
NPNANDSTWKSLKFFPKVLTSDIAFNQFTNTIYVSTFARGIWKNQIPSLNKLNYSIKRNTTFNEPFKIDGVLKLKTGKKLVVNSKLIICSKSKVILSRKSILQISSTAKVVNEFNEPVDINSFIEKHKSAKIIRN